MPWQGDPVWLPDVLRDAGLRVQVSDGAFQRGHGDMGDVWGVFAHHTGNDNASWQSIAFHPELGLASQLHLDQSGLYTVCGVGIAWHAGNGSWPGLGTNNANPRTIGIEAANDGGGAPNNTHHPYWNDAQYDAYVQGVAAILRFLGYGSDRLVAHKEWAGASQGKWDPGGINMDLMRNDVQGLLTGPADPIGGLMATNQEKFDRIHFELTEKFATRSKYSRDPANPYRDTLVGYVLQLDAQGDVNFVERQALLGNRYYIDLVKREADKGDKDSQAVYEQCKKSGFVQ